MESLNKVETLYQALAIIGPATSKKLEEFTGIPSSHVGALLARGARAGKIVCGLEGKRRAFGLPGQIKAAPFPARNTREKPAVVPRVRNRPVKIDNAEFRIASCQAAQAEKLRKFGEAIELWHQAADLAIRPENIEWCKTRAALCEKLPAKKGYQHG